MNKKEYALIVAGGKGTRIPGKIPKQFIELCGKPVLLHTIQAFIRYNRDIEVILVLPYDDFNTWYSIVDRYEFQHVVTLERGGLTRFQSVKNGLQRIQDDGLVAIHDGVRPLVSTEVIGQSFRIASSQKSAVASVSLKDSIRLVDEGQGASKAMNRSKFRLIQTPQTFDVALIKKAYEIKEDESLTDDASVAERFGVVITLFEGSYSNIKITTPEDLVVAESLLKVNFGL